MLLLCTLECIGKLNLLKAQLCAFNTSDSTTIPLTVQNWQITSYVPDSTNKHSTDKQRNFRVPDSTTSSKIACLCTVMHRKAFQIADERLFLKKIITIKRYKKLKEFLGTIAFNFMGGMIAFLNKQRLKKACWVASGVWKGNSLDFVTI